MRRQPEDHWSELDGDRAFYRTVAAGPQAASPPLLLVHGISCCNATWDPFVRELSQRDDAPELVVPDLPAHGQTVCPDRVLGMTDFAAWLEWLLRVTGLEQVDVMGHSMGCQVALALADLYPQRVRRLVLLGPTTGGRHVSALRNFLGLVGDSSREPLPYNLLLTRMFWRMGPRRYLLTVREIQRDDAFVHASRIKAPALVLQGKRDAIIPTQVAQELATVFPTGEYDLIAGAHASQYSHPQPTADRVLAFLREAELVIVKPRVQ